MSVNNDERRVTITSRQLVFALLCLSYVYIVSTQAPITMGWISNEIFNVTTDKTEYYPGDTIAIYVTGTVPTTQLFFEVYDSGGDLVIYWGGLASTHGSWSGDASNMGTYTEVGKIAPNDQTGIYTLTVEDVWGERSVQTNFSVRIDTQPYLSDFNWTLTEPIPSPRRNSSTFIHDCMIFLIGGDDDAYGSKSDTYYSRIYPNGSLGKWVNTTALPIDLDSAQCVVYEPFDTVYVIGGTQSSKASPVESDRVYYASINQTGLGTWQNTTSLPGIRADHASVIWNNRIFVIGGWNGQDALSSVYSGRIEADSTVSSWTPMTKLPQARRMHTAFVFNDWIYVLGGRGLNNSIIRAKIESDGDLGAWSTISSLPTGLWGLKSIVIDEVYLVGGSPESDWVPSNQVISAEIQEDGDLGTWKAEQSLPNAIAGHSAVSWDDIMYVVGGSTTKTDPHDYTDFVYYSSHDHDLISVIVGNGSLIPPDGVSSYEHGSEVLVTAIPAEDMELIHWEHNGHVRSASTNFSITMDRTQLLVAVFGRPSDDNIEGAIELEEGLDYQAMIYPGDRDYYKFNATPGSFYFSTSGDTDTYLHLYDTDGETELAVDDDSGEDLNARILWRFTSSGIYYIKVRGYDESVTGEYNVLVYNASTPTTNIVIDGEMSDWTGISHIVEDPAEDGGGIDILAVYITNDNENLYFRVDYRNNSWGRLYSNITIQAGDLIYCFCVGDDPSSGPYSFWGTASSLTDDCLIVEPGGWTDVNVAASSDYLSLEFSISLSLLEHPQSVDFVVWSARPIDPHDRAPDNGYAQYSITSGSSGSPYLIVAPSYGAPGTTITASGYNFTPYSLVTLGLENTDSPTSNLTTVNALSDGSFKTTFTTPAVAFDWYNITATDDQGLNASTPFKVGIIAIIISPTSGYPGTEVTLTGVGFTPGSYNATLGNITVIDMGIISAGETLSDIFIVPSLPPDNYLLSVVDGNENELAVLFSVLERQWGNWSAEICAEVGGFNASTRFGMKDGATGGFDADAGDLILPPGFAGVETYFYHPENPSSPIDLRKLYVSYLPVEYPANWTFRVHTFTGVSGEATLSWNASDLTAIPSDYYVNLVTPTGSVNMHEASQYTWTADEETTYTFTVKVAHGVIIDQTHISDGRVDVGTTQTVSFHGYWMENSSDVTSGTFYVNEVAYTVNSTGWASFEVFRGDVGQLNWTVTGVQCGDVTSFSQNAADPAIIWDRVAVYGGGASPERVGPLVNSTVWFKARYSYDSTAVDGDAGQISVNGTEMIWSASNSRWELNVSRREAGNVTYVVTNVSEVVYGLSGYTDSAGLVTVYFTGEWNAFLSVDVAGSSAGLVLGLDEGATTGFDASAGDALVSPAPPNGVWAYFDYPDNPSSPVDLRKLSTSLLPVEYPAEWVIKVQTIGVSGDASLDWSSSEIDAIPVNYSVILDTPSGGVDMRSGDSYSWIADADTTYIFTISITSEVEFTLELRAGWNMVSLPVTPNDTLAASIMDGKGFFQLVTWSGTGYVPATSFEAGKGYWLLVLEDVNVTVSGSSVDSLNISLSAGWNMVGGTFDEVPADGVFPGFYQLVTWTGTGYTPATVFEPGRGYWALVLSNTQIELDPN